MKKTKWLMIIAFLVVIGFISVAGVFIKDQKFSENENRYLATSPQFSLDNFISGEFQSDLEEYLNDQIVLRDGWITTKTAIQKMSGDTDIGGAYIGKDGYYFEKIVPQDVNDSLVQRNIASIKEYFTYCENTIDASRLSFLLVPTSGLILENKLPDNAILFDQEAYINKVQQAMADYNFIDVRENLYAHAKEDIYYRTDHHWTMLGAFWAYEAWCEQTRHPFLGNDAYKQNIVTEEFRGSLYSKVLDAAAFYDSIVVMEQKENPSSYSVTADGEALSGFYQEDKLKEKDKYTYFLGGNYGEVIIHNGSDTTLGKNLLVIKDSFANCFLPFIAAEYDNIYVIDLRYYRGDMSSYLEENKITDVLVLYNISNFISDKNIYKLNSGI